MLRIDGRVNWSRSRALLWRRRLSRSPACGVGDSGGGSKEETEKPIAKKVDGDLVYFNWSRVHRPGAASRASRSGTA